MEAVLILINICRVLKSWITGSSKQIVVIGELTLSSIHDLR